MGKPVNAHPMIGDMVQFGQLTQLSYMLVGPLGSGKTTYAEAFLAEGLNLGFPAVFITTDVSPRVIRNDMSRHGWPIEACEKAGHFKFIDAYSERMGAPKTTAAYSLSKIDDISELGIVLSEALEKLVCARVVIDSLSTLILHSSPETMPRSIQRLSGRVTQNSHSIMFVLEEGVHDEKTYATYSYLTDSVLKFKMDDRGPEPVYYISLERMRGTEASRAWRPFVNG
jgi:KaiC/GvpD/RAD55 family RecA-like ATPase